MHDLREPHLAGMKCVMHYLRGSMDFSLQLRRSASSSELTVYTDADWVGCLDTHRSTSGNVTGRQSRATVAVCGGGVGGMMRWRRRFIGRWCRVRGGALSRTVADRWWVAVMWCGKGAASVTSGQRAVGRARGGGLSEADGGEVNPNRRW
jgi:hypothetical protein